MPASIPYLPQFHSLPIQIKLTRFPPSSLDRRSTEFIVSPMKVVGCRGGSRYFEGFRGFLEIPKVQKMDFP